MSYRVRLVSEASLCPLKPWEHTLLRWTICTSVPHADLLYYTEAFRDLWETRSMLLSLRMCSQASTTVSEHDRGCSEHEESGNLSIPPQGDRYGVGAGWRVPQGAETVQKKSAKMFQKAPRVPCGKLLNLC